MTGIEKQSHAVLLEISEGAQTLVVVTGGAALASLTCEVRGSFSLSTAPVFSRAGLVARSFRARLARNEARKSTIEAIEVNNNVNHGKMATRRTKIDQEHIRTCRWALI